MTNTPLKPYSLWPWVYAVIGVLVIGIVMSRYTDKKPRQVLSASIGDKVMIRSGTWVCASSEDALDEISKWAGRHDTDEMNRTIARTRSTILDDGFLLKILDSTLLTRKVRVLGWLDPKDGKIHSYPEEKRIGRECWVPMEAVTQ